MKQSKKRTAIYCRLAQKSSLLVKDSLHYARHILSPFIHQQDNSRLMRGFSLKEGREVENE